MNATKIPTPTVTDSRICFGLSYFTTRTDASRYAKFVRSRGDKYNGGYFDGMPCGREPQFDYTDEKLGRLFAVSTS